MANAWQLATMGRWQAGIESSRVIWVGSGVKVCYLLFWSPLREVIFGLVGQPVGETAARISQWGYADAWRMWRSENWFGFWEILNFSFGLVFWHTRRQHRMVYWYIDKLMRGWSVGTDWQLPTFWVCFLFINLCRVKSVRFVVRILDVYHFNCNVLLCPLSTDIILVISHCCFHCYFVNICTLCCINP